ncbi:MAG: excinuclease ABC subunit UvrC [Candidatus Woesearchaeota archaeon]|nr:MAG: excinuclease ABC subunit UvrC [Candidatus Woesearchaeota archaeon]
MIDLKKVPLKPGCYLFRDTQEKIIYVGKAKNLRKRVSSYFQKQHEDKKTQQLVSSIAGMDFIVTANEVEALLLEENLIHKHKPKYNIDLKETKRYAYLLITDEPYPRLITARTKGTKGKYFGPFTNGYLREVLATTLRKAFYIRTCKQLPKRVCLRYHIGLCKGPCEELQTKKDYDENITRTLRFLKGDNESLKKEVQKEMLHFAKLNRFEKAQERKEQLAAIELLNEHQIVSQEQDISEDAINYVRTENEVVITVFTVRNGLLRDKDTYKLAPEEEVLDEFVKRYYADNHVPGTIVIPHELHDKAIHSFLEEKAGKKVKLVVPLRGAKKDLLLMIQANIDAEVDNFEKIAEEFKEALSLRKKPFTFECFDISHLSGEDIVGSMVHFERGKPIKSNYRRFKIRTVEDNDDFRSMREIVYRRYHRLSQERKTMPDLIIVDGGEQQLAFALHALKKIGVTIPIIGLAKKFEEIYLPGKKEPLRFDKKKEFMKELIKMRDEAHRFAITYQRLLRSKRTFKDDKP